MEIVPVHGSSKITGYGWEPRWPRKGYTPRTERLGLLLIEFTGGAKWYYAEVPEEVFELFMMAQSKGRFFNEHIRGRYAEAPVAEVDQPKPIAAGDPIAPDY